MKVRKKISIFFIVIISLSIALLYACSSEKGASATIKDGIIELEGTKLDFGSNAVTDSSNTMLTTINFENEKPDGLASKLFELKLDVTCDSPVSISIPLTEDEMINEGDAAPMLGLGTDIILSDGRVETLYTYMPAELADGMVTATFTPSEYLQQYSVRGSLGGAKPSRESLRLGIFWCSTTFKDGGHFIVYFPAKSGSLFINYNDRDALLSDLEAVYNEYIGKGYVYAKRSSWPIEVNIQSLDAMGYYSYGWSGANGKIYLDRKLFEGGYKAATVKPLIAHEFFHFVQLNYEETSNDNLWFDEATATYFEWQKSGSIPSIVAEYNEKIFSGVFPEENTAANGYSRMPLIRFLSKKLSENFILNVYTDVKSGTDWNNALVSATGPLGDWAADFYEALVKGEVSNYAPYTLHSNIADGNGKEIGTMLELKMPTEDELITIVENDEIPLLGETTVNIGPYGAQMVALTIDSTNLFRVKKGTDPVVSVSGGDLRVFSIRGSDVTVLKSSKGSIKLDDFKELSENKHLFLALVTGLHSSGKQDYNVRVELPPYPTLDELVGDYKDGEITFTDIYISPEMKASASSEDSSSVSEEKDLGCDIDIDIDVLAQIEGLKGKSEPHVLRINKIGEDTGVLVLVDDEGDPSDPLQFTYTNGLLTFEHTVQGLVLSGDLVATYGKNKDVIIDGDLRIKTINSDNFKIDLHLNGSKPLELP